MTTTIADLQTCRPGPGLRGRTWQTEALGGIRWVRPATTAVSREGLL